MVRLAGLVPFSTSSAIFLATLSSFYTPVAHAIRCTYPGYGTEVRPGQTSLLSWQFSDEDINLYESFSATLYCMDLAGPQGGMWRDITTLFSKRGLQSAMTQFTYNVPNCGQQAKDVAIRIVAYGRSGTQNDACHFTMARAAVVEPPEPPTVAPPKTATLAPPVTAQPPVSRPSNLPTVSSILPLPTPSQSISGTMTKPTGIPGLALPSDSRPYPDLPPLPPIPEGPPTDYGPDGGSSKAKTIGAALGSACTAAALVVLVSILVMRRRRSRGRPSMPAMERIMPFGASGRGKGRGKGSMRQKLLSRNDCRRSEVSLKEGYFFRMEEEDEATEGHMSMGVVEHEQHHPHHPHQQQQQQHQQRMLTTPLVDLEDQQPLPSESTGQPPLAVPPHVHLEPTRRWSTISGSELDAWTMSSCETSSVVRQYWQASMAAREERRAAGYPSMTSALHEQWDDQSSESRMAEILTLSSGGSVQTTETSFQRYKRLTIESMQSYMRRSMSLSLASQHTTTTEDSQHPPGFRPPIDADFLDYLNIKALGHERQLEYSSHYYRQNAEIPVPETLTMTMTTDRTSYRSSSAPSLTSTNDPFLQNFDSNEIMPVDLGPFSDTRYSDPELDVVQHQEAVVLRDPDTTTRTTTVMTAPVMVEGRSNSNLLSSFPPPPLLLSRSAST